MAAPVELKGKGRAPEVSRKPPPKLRGLTFEYTPAPDDGFDANLLVLLHGLGDCAAPFHQLGRSLRLPQTAVLAINAPARVPLLEERNLQWYDSFDLLTGDPVKNPDPSQAIKLLHDALVALTQTGWPRLSIHLFGFAQGGSLAVQAALTLPATVELGSVVTVSGPLLSTPAKGTKPRDTPILAWRRTGDRDMARTEWKAGFASVQEVELPARPGGAAMPRSTGEWQPIMRFWSERLRTRPSFGNDVVELS